MNSLNEVVQAVRHSSDDSEQHSSPSNTYKGTSHLLPRLLDPPKRRSSGYASAPGSPAGRTGPPSSFFPISTTPSGLKGKGRISEVNVESDTNTNTTPSRINSQDDTAKEAPENQSRSRLTDPYSSSFVRTQSGFRGAWEYEDHDSPGRLGSSKRNRESWLDIDGWNPKKWLGLTETEKDSDNESSEENRQSEEPKEPIVETPKETPTTSAVATAAATLSEEASKSSRVPRSLSLPHMRTTPTWNKLKALLPQVIATNTEGGTNYLEAAEGRRDVDIINELTFSGLSTLMLRMWYERDDRDERRVPILLQHLRIRVSDSIYPLSNSKAVFRIECEYANGAARWVIYRQLRDFNSLNRHYRVANFYTMNSMDLPEFPRTSIGNKLHYYKLKREKGATAGRAEYARLQREELENYLAGMMKAVVGRLQ